MPCQSHAVMQQPQYIDGPIPSDSEEHKVSPPSAMSSDMQGVNAWPNVGASFRASNFRSLPQCLDDKRNSLCVSFSLTSTKGLGGPFRDFGIVAFGLTTKPNISRRTHTTAMALPATDLRCALNASDESKTENRSASKSASPTRTALRKASRREASSASLCSTRRSPSRRTSLAF